MKPIKATVMTLAAFVATVGWAGESVEFRLDTMDGSRIARAVETISYSTGWNNGGTVSVAVDGVAIKEANAPAYGDVVWNASHATPGTHTLTHTCGGETLTALFEVVQAPLSDVVIIFNANGGVGEIDNMSVNSGLVLPTLFPGLSDSVDFPDPTSSIAPPSPSHKFIGWALSADVNGINNPEALVKTTNDLRNYFLEGNLPANGVVHLFAIWAKFFTVSFDANCGAGTMPPQTIFDGKKQKLSKNAYTKGSNKFLGWAVSDDDARDGIVKYPDEGEFPENGSDISDKILYAVWTTSVTVSFYNESDQTLRPASLGNYLKWKVEGEDVGVWHRQGEFKELEPGKYYNFLIEVADDVAWMAWPESIEKAAYIVSASSYDFASWRVGSPLQHKVWVKVDVKGGNGPSVCFETNAEKVDGQTFDPSTAIISLVYRGLDGHRQPTEYKGLSANEWYKLPWGIYDVSAETETADGQWIAHPIYSLNLSSDAGDHRRVYLDFFYRQKEDSLSGIEVKLNPNAIGAKIDPDVLNVFAHYERSWMQFPRLPTPKYAFHEFQGWWTEPKGGYKVEVGQRIDCIVEVLYAQWKWRITSDWLSSFSSIFNTSNGDIATASSLPAANGCRTVGECFELGINPEDPDDDFRITNFEMKDGKPVITLNHTEDGSGNSFLPRVKTLGAKSLDASAQGTKSPGTAAQWDDMADVADPEAAGYRFFKVEVEMP